jgi:hypothetical protein
MEPDHSESPSDDPAGRSAAAFERLVCERLDVVMTARGFSAGQGGSSGPVGSVLYCGITGELHEKYPEVVDAPEAPEWECYDVVVEGSLATGVSAVTVEAGTEEEALARLGQVEMAQWLSRVSALPVEDGLNLVDLAIETLFP